MPWEDHHVGKPTWEWDQNLGGTSICWTTCWPLKCQYETLPTKRSWRLWLKVAGKSMEGWSKCRAASAGSSNPRFHCFWQNRFAGFYYWHWKKTDPGVVKSRVGCVGPSTANFGRWSGPGVQLTSREVVLISQTCKAKPDVLQKLKQQGWHLTAAPFHPDTWFWVYHGKDSGGKLKLRHVV